MMMYCLILRGMSVKTYAIMNAHTLSLQEVSVLARILLWENSE